MMSRSWRREAFMAAMQVDTPLAVAARIYAVPYTTARRWWAAHKKERPSLTLGEQAYIPVRYPNKRRIRTATQKVELGSALRAAVIEEVKTQLNKFFKEILHASHR